MVVYLIYYSFYHNEGLIGKEKKNILLYAFGKILSGKLSKAIWKQKSSVHEVFFGCWCMRSTYLILKRVFFMPFLQIGVLCAVKEERETNCKLVF